MKASMNKRKSIKDRLAVRNEIGSQNMTNAIALARAISSNFVGPADSVATFKDGSTSAKLGFTQSLNTDGRYNVTVYLNVVIEPTNEHITDEFRAKFTELIDTLVNPGAAKNEREIDGHILVEEEQSND